MIHRTFKERLNHLSSMQGFLLVFALTAVVYLATATYNHAQSVDTVMAAWSAQSLAQEGTLDLSGRQSLLELSPVATGQAVEVNGRLYANRFPGAILLGVPFYAVGHVLGAPNSPSVVMGGIAAATIAAAAIGVLHLVMRRVADPALALWAALGFAFGTATWSVSANALWTHGSAQFWLILGMLALANGRHSTSGLGWGMALFTRPHLGFAAAAAALHRSMSCRRMMPAALLGLTTALGLAAWVAYGRLIFGEWTLAGGYVENARFSENLADQTPWRALVNLWWMIVHPVRGFLFYSPFLVGLIPAIPKAWREAPPWIRSGALAGLVYLASQAWINRWSGGDAYWSYRYPLEMLTLVAPLLLVAYQRLGGERRRVVVVGLIAAIALQLPGAVLGIRV